MSSMAEEIEGDSSGDESGAQALSSAAHVGEQLRAAREACGMTLKDIASKTRIPMRHLETVEAGDFSSLPGRTYAIGFGRAYARVVDLPEDDIAQGIRQTLGDSPGSYARDLTQFDIDEPSKLPPARIAWLAAAVGAIILIAGFGIWRTFFFPAANVEELAQAADAASVGAAGSAASSSPAAKAPAAALDPKAPVVFTATEDKVWIKFYDGEGKQLMQKQMALGEQYVIPTDAVDPQVWTGRPDAFEITIAGRTVAPLGTSEVAVKDVPVTAEALMARPQVPTQPSAKTGSNADQTG